jgi:hypothetical protein
MARFDDLQIEILYSFWEDAYQPGRIGYYAPSELSQVLREDLITPSTRVAMGALEAKNHLRNASGKYGISEVGINFIEEGLADPESAVSLVTNKFRDKPEATAENTVPASDRLVALDHNGDPYREAISALDAAVTAFREDHRLDNEWGPEKPILLQAIEAGQKLLKETQVRLATVFTTIITPLRIIRDRYNDSLAAGLITAGADHLISIVEKAASAVLSLVGLS